MRPANLVIICLTMYALRWGIMKPLLDGEAIGMKFAFGNWPFFFSVLVVLCIAAAGNVINDYFDVPVDRINKPGRMIVGRYVKRRVAMILHQVLNALALVIAIGLAWKSRLWMALVIPGTMSILFWFYSPLLKRTKFIGNVAVAIGVGLVPMWTGLFELSALHKTYGDMMHDMSVFGTIWNWLFCFSGFAFLLTLSREAQKDMEDMEGDLANGFRTLPVTRGIKWTKNYSLALLAFTAAASAFCLILLMWKFKAFSLPLVGAYLVLVATPIFLSMKFIFFGEEKENFAKASMWNKWAMAGGVLLAFVLRWYLEQRIAF